MEYKITREEFVQRVRNTQAAMEAAGLDILLTYGNEAEPQYVRYYSNYWPSFESAMVMIPKKGDAILLIGPESETLATYWSEIPRIERIKILRESSEPEYPGEKLNTLYNLFNEVLDADAARRIGICGYPLMYAPVYEGIKQAAAAFGCEVVRAEELVIAQKIIKTPTEIEIMKRAAVISEAAMVKAIETMHSGMTETQVVGIAEGVIRELGAEGEAYPMWVLSGENTTHAIGRPDPTRVIQKNDVVELQFGARLAGYASSIGRPVIIGKVSEDAIDLIKVGLEAHLATFEWLKPGVPAKELDRKYRQFLKAHGAEGCNLYGPCHGTGLMEGEHPWIEATSEYLLKPGFTYEVDTFIKRNGIGLRWEDQAAVTETGCDVFTNKYLEMIYLEQ